MICNFKNPNLSIAWYSPYQIDWRRLKICGFLAEAQKVFEKLHVHDVNSWTSLITGYVNCGHFKEALICLELMELENVPSNVVIIFAA